MITLTILAIILLFLTICLLAVVGLLAIPFIDIMVAVAFINLVLYLIALIFRKRKDE